MTRNVVNLDALIPRQDLSAPTEASYADIPGIKITDLEPGLIYSWLRKPDFQRETANWSPEQVADLVESFANGNIIPAIIVWQNGPRVFVVDGAHRLSALIAWVQDDYGAGKRSAELYKNIIPEHQKAMHDATKRLVHQKVGSYYDHVMASKFPEGAAPEILQRASQFPFRNIDVQWIRNAGVTQARDAFFRINQGGTKIDPTETRILRANNSALAISARAITRGGSGHDYWNRFDPLIQKEIEELGADTHKLLFTPQLKVPVKTLDVPVAGFGYGSHTLPFSFDLVTLSNNLPIAESTRKRSEDKGLEDDLEGEETVRYLKAVKKITQLICSTDPSSLGLNPALYFYTPTGIFQSAAFFNATRWFMELRTRQKLNQFIKVRREFEDLILAHPVIVKPAAHKLGSGARTRPRMLALYGRVLELLSDGNSAEEVWEKIITESDFMYLAPDDHEEKQQAHKGVPGRRFERKAKSAGFLEQFLPPAPRCALCGGLLHTNGMVADHETEREKGGSSASSNARMVHPICSSNRKQLNA